jgi:D-alanyl-lipoteichoic acid acyltransferase DltB (MBOAT superfamily)
MGFTLMKNFNRPYFSKTISEFWGRWHISLSTWFRDYLYIPLGGNRVIKSRWYFNLFITFMISGFWHGANWTFIIWGALHGFYLIFALITAKQRNSIVRATGLTANVKVYKLVQVLTVFALASFAWIFFRANSLADAGHIIYYSFAGIGNVTELFSGDIYHVLFLDTNPKIFYVAVLSIILMEVIHLYQRNGSMRALLATRPAWVRWSLYYGFIAAVLFLGAFGEGQFIYFQF